MSSTVALLAPEGEWSCDCGFAGYTHAFEYRFESNTDSNWLICPKCGAELRLTPSEETTVFWSDDHYERMAFWNHKKAMLGKYNNWRIVSLVEQSIDPKVLLGVKKDKKTYPGIKGTADAHKHMQTLKEILKPLNKEDTLYLCSRFGIKIPLVKAEKVDIINGRKVISTVFSYDWSEYMCRKDIKWNWLSQAITLAKATVPATTKNWTLTKDQKEEIKERINLSASNEDITVSDRPIAHIATESKKWLHNPCKRGPKFYSVERIDKWMIAHGIDPAVGELPKIVDDVDGITAQKMHTLTDINNRSNKLKVDEWTSDDEDIDPIDAALIDNAYGEYTELKGKVGRGMDEQLFVDHMVGLDDTDCDPSCECPDEEDNSFESFIYNSKAA